MAIDARKSETGYQVLYWDGNYSTQTWSSNLGGTGNRFNVRPYVEGVHTYSIVYNEKTSKVYIDGELISAQFFENFSRFVRNYVYPTLKAFKAKLSIKGKMTFIPYVRSKVTYVASDAGSMYENFMVEEENKPEEHIPYEVESIYGNMEKFKVLREDEN